VRALTPLTTQTPPRRDRSVVLHAGPGGPRQAPPTPVEPVKTTRHQPPPVEPRRQEFGRARRPCRDQATARPHRMLAPMLESVATTRRPTKERAAVVRNGVVQTVLGQTTMGLCNPSSTSPATTGGWYFL
jgi:hypothetical protein